MRRLLIFALAILAMTPSLPSHAPADETAEFHSLLADAYGHYREAVFYARRDNAMTAAFELEAFAEKWKALQTAYPTPPAAYAKEADWRRILDGIAKRVADGLNAATEGDGKSARAHLLPIRETLADLRKRNGVVTFSDQVESANAAFRHLFHFRRNPPDFADPAQVDDLRQRLAATINAYENCRDKAPGTIASDEQFQRLIKDSLFYLRRINVAIEEKNQLSVVNILRRVVSSDKILWFRFG